MRDFERAVKQVQRKATKAVQTSGKKAHRRQGRRHARGQYANAAGQLKRLGSYGPKQRRRKQQLKLDMRRGVMRKGILKVMNSPQAFSRIKTGFEIDITRPDITVTGRATIGKSRRATAGKRILQKDSSGVRQVVGIAAKLQVTNRRSFRVQNYIHHYAKQKAPGLGAITSRDQKEISEDAGEAVEAHINSIRGATRSLSRQAATKITIRLGKIVQ